jgi:2-polyprenyl-6-methoxyphenol hydroxylase-like FAD-dependent oxidoreductase
MPDRYDVIVVGARCAGAPTAMLLARQGLRVLLLDKARFPSDKLSAPYLHASGVEQVRRWGLLDQLVRSGAPALRRLLVDLGNGLEFVVDHEERSVLLHGVVVSRLAGDEPDSVAYAPRRLVLDQILVEAAVQAGAELHPGCVVEDLMWEADRVVGVLSRTGSQRTAARAEIVVGADGVNSVVARAVRAPMVVCAPVATCAYHTCFRGIDAEGMEVYLREGLAIMVLPTNDGLLHIGVARPRAAFSALRTDVTGTFFRALNAVPPLAQRVLKGVQAEPITGTAALPNYFRQPFGPGWVLAGDAGYAHDPITGLGMSNAFRDAELVSAAIHRHLGTDTALDSAFADYQRDRDASSRVAFDIGNRLAALTPPGLDTLMLMATVGRGRPPSQRGTHDRQSLNEPA